MNKPYVLKPRAPIETFNNLGTKTIIKAKLSINDNGEKIAEPGEEYPLDAYIQSFKASTDIVAIIAKLEAGDESVINYYPNGGLSGDLTQLPRNVNDIVALGGLSDKALENFNNLPDGIKALFDNDSSKFFEAVLNGTADALVSDYIKNLVEPQPVEKKEEIKEGDK